MFGKDDLKELREALAATGCDMSCFRRWQKMYEKLSKQLPSVREQYESARSVTEQVEKIARELEQIIVQGETSSRDNQKRFAELVKELKRAQNTFDHEFIVSKEDKELHTTYDSIIRLGVKALEKPDQKLIIQSEIENLLSLLRENLEKEEPGIQTLCFFYQEHSDKELIELPPAERISCIVHVYEEEFIEPIATLLLESIPQADYRQEQLADSNSRGDRRTAEQLRLLWNRPGEQFTSQARAQRIITELLRDIQA